MEKIKITTESTCDLSEELIKKFDIGVLPLLVTLGEDTYHDGIDVTTKDLYEYFDKTGELPKTGAVSPADYKDFFQKYLDEGYDKVLHIGLGYEMSSCCANAQAAAEDMENVIVVDTETLSSGVGLFAMYASELNKLKKYTAEEIAKKVESRVSAGQASFVIEKLKFLYKGGRCSMLSVLGANLLRLKPCIRVKAGRNGVGTKFMGNMTSCIKKYVDETLKLFNNPDPTRVLITYSTATEEMVATAKQALEEAGIFKEILVTEAGSVISSHCGPNTLGILYINDGDGHLE